MSWFREWYMVIIVPALCFAFVFWIMSRPRAMTVSVPIEFCKSQYTGRTKAEDVPIQSCAAYNQNMTCMVPITTWSTVTRNETRVTCDYVEWR